MTGDSAPRSERNAVGQMTDVLIGVGAGIGDSGRRGGRRSLPARRPDSSVRPSDLVDPFHYERPQATDASFRQSF